MANTGATDRGTEASDVIHTSRALAMQLGDQCQKTTWNYVTWGLVVFHKMFWEKQAYSWVLPTKQTGVHTVFCACGTETYLNLLSLTILYSAIAITTWINGIPLIYALQHKINIIYLNAWSILTHNIVCLHYWRMVCVNMWLYSHECHHHQQD